RSRHSAHEGSLLDRGEPYETADLLKIPLFSGIPRKLLDDNHGAVVLRHFAPGDVICRQGDYGATAFYVMSGTCDVCINTPIAGVDTRPKTGFMGLVRRMGSLLKPGAEGGRFNRPTPSHVHIDAPVDLPWGQFSATIGPESLFGEMTCLNFYPRSATVIARES